MARIAIVLILLIGTIHIVIGQDIYRSVHDSSFRSGDLVRIPGLIHCTCHTDPVCPDAYDSIAVAATFLQQHPELHVVIEVHSDTRGSDSLNLKLTQKYAEIYKDAVITRHGIDGARIVAQGMGETQPLIPEPKIIAVASREEKEALHERNRRYVLRVL